MLKMSVSSFFSEMGDFCGALIVEPFHTLRGEGAAQFFSFAPLIFTSSEPKK